MRRDLPVVLKRLREIPANDVAISALTKGELLYGLEKRQNPSALTRTIMSFLRTVTVLPWTTETAETYGVFNAKCMQRGIGLSAIDMMIAAHAISLGAILVTRDKAFSQVGENLKIESWM